jgi:hypothetical protein
MSEPGALTHDADLERRLADLATYHAGLFAGNASAIGCSRAAIAHGLFLLAQECERQRRAFVVPLEGISDAELRQLVLLCLQELERIGYAAPPEISSALFKLNSAKRLRDALASANGAYRTEQNDQGG